METGNSRTTDFQSSWKRNNRTINRIIWVCSYIRNSSDNFYLILHNIRRETAHICTVVPFHLFGHVRPPLVGPLLGIVWGLHTPCTNNHEGANWPNHTGAIKQESWEVSHSSAHTHSALPGFNQLMWTHLGGLRVPKGFNVKGTASNF